MSSKHPELVRFIKEFAVMHGQFKLASGLTSDYYIDGKQIVSRPDGLRLVAEAIREELADYPVDAIGGLEIGAIYIATAVAFASVNWPKPIPLFTVRKAKKEHGSQKQVEGVIPEGGSVAVVDDVVTTGGSVIQAIEAIRGKGCRVALAVTIVDRCSGAAEALADLGVPYRPLLSIVDLGLSNEQTCRSSLQRTGS
jgi:orotate phosphoribosyltransferase